VDVPGAGSQRGDSITKIILGQAGKRTIALDLPVLLRTRLLIQANSGGGKSWLLRRIAEQAFGRVQVIIVDPEGDFATLREKYGYVLVGKGGETPADVRSATLVAHKLLELNASAVCDLYEMKVSQRHEWVRLFLEAMLDSPKRLWHPVLVIVDEAHVFCPEKGAGESVAGEAMIGLASRGRKRGFCAIFATQRLGKLRKDAAAELTNVLIGPTFIDIDRKRAAEALGIPRSDERKFSEEMRVMEPGHFWSLGRAVSLERMLFTVGAVATTHPEAGSGKQAAEPPPAPEKIKSLLPKLADLPQAAEQKARTEAELRRELADSQRKVRALESRALAVAAPTTPVRIEVSVFKDGEVKRLESAVEKLAGISTKQIELGNQLAGAAREFSTALRAAANRPAPQRTNLVQSAPRSIPARAPVPLDSESTLSLPKAERSILTVLAQHPDGRTKTQLAILAGYAVSGGGFNNAIGRLRSLGLVHGGKEHLQITDAGAAGLGNWEPLPSGRDLIDYWLRELPKAERAVLSVLVEVWPSALSKEDLAGRAGYEASGGGFNNALGKLRTLELATGRNEIKASDELCGGS